MLRNAKKRIWKLDGEQQNSSKMFFLLVEFIYLFFLCISECEDMAQKQEDTVNWMK